MEEKIGNSEMPDNYNPYNNSYKSNASSTDKYLDTYYYASNTKMKDNFINSEAFDVIFESGNSYWVATRVVSFGQSNLDRNDTYAQFGVRIISGKELKQQVLMQSDSGTDITLKNMLSVRPVVVVPKSAIDL